MEGQGSFTQCKNKRTERCLVPSSACFIENVDLDTSTRTARFSTSVAYPEVNEIQVLGDV